MGDRLENANGYIELARISQEQLWKRRQVQWKANFSIIAGIALITYFFLTFENFPAVDKCYGFRFYIAITVFYILWQLRVTKSNYNDKKYMAYYLNRVLIQLRKYQKI